MSDQQKLTKKQRKSLAFRQKRGKGKGAGVDDEERDVPVLDNLNPDSADLPDPQPSRNLSEANSKSTSADKKGKTKDDGKDVEQNQHNEAARRESKKRKRAEEEAGNLAGERAGDTDAEATEHEQKKTKKSRYILFVGNLKYTTSKEDVEKHFSVCDPPPEVRLLTPKSTAKPTAKSKGCAFLEFSHKNALQQALKLHQSELDGRKINVELTAGGGGKSEARLQKVKERNKGLASQRIKRIQKQTGKEVEPEVERPQRHSTTSGVDEVPLKKRTWSVADADDGQTHRGGKKHDKKRGSKRKLKDWGTGVNAIPVG